MRKFDSVDYETLATIEDSSQWAHLGEGDLVGLCEALDDNPALATYLNEIAMDKIEDVDDLIAYFEEVYCGEYECAADYAAELYADCYDIPAHLECYIDYGAIARDMEFDCYTFCEVGYKVVYVFRPN